MENISNLREYTFKKNPTAKLVASVLLILGGISTNVNADMDPTYKEAINNKNIILTSDQEAEHTIIQDDDSLILTAQAKAFNTEIDTNSVLLSFLLKNKSQANLSTIRNGKMEITDNATASKTFLGLTEEENELRLIANPKTPEIIGRMDISKDGTAKDTTIGIYGQLYVGGSGTAENTHIKKGGKLVVQGNMASLSDTTIEGELELDSDVMLISHTKFLSGSELKTNGSDIINNGDIIFSGIGGGMLANIEGSGSLTIESPGKTLILQSLGSGKYMYSGLTHIKAGTLKLSEAHFSYSPIIAEAGTELVLFNSILDTNVNGGRMAIDGQSIWYMARDSSVAALNISENSQIHLNHGQVGNKLTINGDYHSDGGTLTFYSKLAGDESETDRMIVEGNTSGHTNVKINNLGGEGAKTDLGILLIEVKGLSDGDFKQVGRNPAGAFEYFLKRGSEVDSRKNWYMISDAPSVDKKPTPAEEKIKVEEPAIPKAEKEDDKTNKPKETKLANASQTTAPATEIKNEPENISVDKSPENTKNTPKKDINTVAAPNKPEVKIEVESSKNAPQKTYKPVYRPENGSYIANLSMARNLFTTDLDNRSGNYKYKDAATGEWRTSSMWIQTQGGIKQFGKTVDQLNIKGKYYSIQLGGDVAKWDIGTQGSGRIGMLAGMGKATNHSKSNITGYYSNGSVNGYNLGVYATWLTDQQNKTGLYIDTLVQYSWFNNAVNGQELAEEKYKSSGFTSSIESGYTFNIGSTEQLSYFIQPNAQITWVGINAQTHTAANKDIINYTNRSQLITRIGAKTYLQTTNSSDQQFMPFIAVNWLHQDHNTGTQLSGKSVENSSKNSAEFKIGVESKIDQRLHAWANINHQIGNYNTSDTNALVGIKYAF
ncbi:autotransporter outer membrane beta-barrel domain-containing protein [Yersinia proxima]|uniref:autotransporter outer membrane beta-barrel domain-containing protein n=1 Tax=Yersinia proxima TaxID=2890316 RepID=UPI001D118611|nr:autotransporter outer membrane beta-barrel domain-containing protein [Yersinia proxima]